MHHRSDMTYVYDGSFDGMMCCVFESYEKKEMPLGIQPECSGRSMLFDAKWIETDMTKAERVYTAIKEKVSSEARDLVDLSFLTCLPEREMHILRFLRLAFKVGGQVMDMITEDSLYQLQRAVKQLTGESHKLKGFVRFSICSNVLVAVIEPRNNVLPLLEPHFCDRYQSETFMIYDKAHKSALIYHPRESMIVDLEEYTMPVAPPEEVEYRQLWRQFYNTIAIEGRYNPRCRMSHMPKRYWRHLTEFNTESDTTLLRDASQALGLPGKPSDM